ncbi:phage tail spike protein [Oceanobacillus alkalisoli]|uniref:phage tail spike protein n=1 Tax=Oceanobacillus alkalisoli TaxID=2925113 RepID=UPI001EE9C7FF|nr:phage tail spike protein [Oceanobacillus alkalisoli]MCF3941562.1 hypothetical protein [Oceanobacillus alkalisoli]
MFPKLYNANETSFIHNGLGLLTGAVDVVATEELNGMFELKMEYDPEGFLAGEIQEEMIIKAKANDKQDEQLFRIYSITKNHENDNLIIDAQHITYDLANNFVEELHANNLTKKQVMELIGSGTAYPHPFNVTSTNTTTQSSTSLYRTNPLQMVAGTQGSVLQTWGGQIERDNFNLIMHDRRGSDDGVLVTYKKNLTGLTAKFDISNLVTRIFPFKFIEATEDEPEQLITVPGKYIDSPHINDYEMPYILPVDFSSEEDIETSQDLLNAASGWFVETGRDKLKVEMEVQFEHLWETEEYKDIAALELVGIGDTITVRHGKLKVDGSAIVNRIEYDVIARKNRSVDVGSVKARFSDRINNIDDRTNDINDKIDEIEKDHNESIKRIDGKNTIYYGPDEPTGDLVEGDLWFKVVDGEYVETYRYDGIQWQLIVSADVKDIEEKANKAHERANDAVDRADKATEDANKAIENAQKSFDKAQDALNSADAAKLASDAAGRVASDAASLATTARDDADKAMSDARTALGGVDDLQTNVNSEFQRINGELSSKINQTTFDGLQGTVTSHSTLIQQNAEGITRKADKTYVDTVNNTVENHSFLIEETAEGLKAKANQSTVNTLTGEVQAHEAQLQLHAQELSSKMTTTDADAKYATQSQLTQTSNRFSSEITSVQGEIDGLEYENRNLLVGTSDEFVRYDRTTGWGDHQPYNSVKVTPGETYTARIYLNNISGDKDVQLRLRATPGSGYVDFSGEWIQPGSEGYSTVTFKVPADRNTLIFMAVRFNTNTASRSVVDFKEAKLEIGTRATPHSKAPEDIQFQFSSIEQTVDSITTRVGDSEGNISALQQTASSIATRITDAEGNISSLTQTVKGFQTRVSDVEGNVSSVTQLATALQTRITDAEGNISSLTQTSSSLDSTIKSVRDDLEGLEIGGRNLLTGTKKELTYVNVSGWGDLTPSGTNESSLFSQGIIETGETYTFRAFIDASQSAYPVNIFARAPNSGNPYRDYSSNKIPAGRKGYATVTFTIPSNTTNIRLYVVRFSQRDTPSQRVGYGELILIKGDKVLADWSPAPEDLATQSQISQLADNINLRVKEGDVINQINIDTSGVLISGKQLILDGDTTVTGTFRVGNANITELNAGKITAGTLDVGKLTVIGLTANSIIGGILQSQNNSVTFNLNNGNLSMGNAQLTFGGTGNNFNGRIDYSGESFRFQRDPYTYLHINRGGSSGGDGISSRRNLFAMMAKGTNMIRFGLTDDGYDHAIITGGTVALKMLAGSTRQLQIRHYGDNAYADLRAQDIEAMGQLTVSRNVTFQNQLIATENSHLYIRPHVSSSNEVRIADTAGRYHPLRAASFPTGSLAEYKEDIHAWNESALAVINQSTIYQYRLKGTEKLRYGLVIGEGYNTPHHVIDGDGVEQYAMNSISWKAIQEVNMKVDDELSILRKQNEDLTLKVARLEARLNKLEVSA